MGSTASLRRDTTALLSLRPRRRRRHRQRSKVRCDFDAWNRRDMEAAVALFSEDVTYEDTVYPEVFSGRDELEFHLLRVADALPRSFVFVVDDISSGSDDARRSVCGGTWSRTAPLCLLQGAHHSTRFDSDGNINTGFDLVEPSIKPGSASLAVLSLASKVLKLLKR